MIDQLDLWKLCVRFAFVVTVNDFMKFEGIWWLQYVLGFFLEPIVIEFMIDRLDLSITIIVNEFWNFERLWWLFYWFCPELEIIHLDLSKYILGSPVMLVFMNHIQIRVCCYSILIDLQLVAEVKSWQLKLIPLQGLDCVYCSLLLNFVREFWIRLLYFRGLDCGCCSLLVNFVRNSELDFSIFLDNILILNWVLKLDFSIVLDNISILNWVLMWLCLCTSKILSKHIERNQGL